MMMPRWIILVFFSLAFPGIFLVANAEFSLMLSLGLLSLVAFSVLLAPWALAQFHLQTPDP